jgi:hypothetical protein
MNSQPNKNNGFSEIPFFDDVQTPNFNQIQTPNFNQNQTPNFNQNQTPNFNQNQTPNFNQNQNSNYNYQNNQQSNPQQIQTNNYWQQFQFYSKTPVFLKSCTPFVFMGNFQTKKFEMTNQNNFSFPLYSSKCELPDGTIFISGGDNQGENLSTCCIYNLNKNTLTQRRPMNYARKLHTSIYLNGFVYVFGGYNGNDIFNSVERYDLQNDTWSLSGNMNINRAYTSLLRYGNDYIFIIGGAQGLSDEVNNFYIIFLIFFLLKLNLGIL